MNLSQENDFLRIAAGDEAAFERVFRAHFKSLCIYANMRLRDTEAAREVVQDLFCSLWEKHSEIQIHTSIQSYLYKAVHNACLNYIKHEKVKEKSRQHFLSQPILMEGEGEQEIETADLEQVIRTTLDSLPEKTKQIFEMVRFREKKYREVAEELDISQKTVEAHMTMALRSLRTALQKFMPLWIILLTFFNRVSGS